MNEITIVEIGGELVVDSRIIAEQLENEHRSFLKLVKKHQVKLEAKFGVLRFEIAKPLEGTSGGRPETFCWLTEGQATGLLTLCRNTDRVVDLKFELVEKFQAQKHQLENPVDRALFDELASRIANLEAATRPALPPVVPELTRSMQVRELIANYVERMGCEFEAAWRLLYTKFGLLYHWKPAPKSKASKIAQIEAAGKIEELYQLALRILI